MLFVHAKVQKEGYESVAQILAYSFVSHSATKCGAQSRPSDLSFTFSLYVVSMVRAECSIAVNILFLLVLEGLLYQFCVNSFMHILKRC